MSDPNATSTDTDARPHSRWALLAFGGATAAVAAAGSVVTARALRSPWYLLLRKPRFQPPKQAFGPVWTGLYALMSVSAWRVWRARSSPTRTRALALWGGQLVLNGAWSWIFFGAKKPRAALVDLALTLGATVAYASEARKIDRPAAALMLPYIGWTAFAGAINEEIARRG